MNHPKIRIATYSCNYLAVYTFASGVEIKFVSISKIASNSYVASCALRSLDIIISKMKFGLFKFGNLWSFTKFGNFSPCQSFPPYGTYLLLYFLLH